MYVVVTHSIADQAKFAQRGEDMLQNIPQGITSHQFLPASASASAFCLWEADSVEALRDHIDGALTDASRQEYFPVAAEQAIGLPQTAKA